MSCILYFFRGFETDEGAHLLLEDTGEGVRIRVSSPTPATFTPADFERFVALMREGFERIAQMRAKKGRHPDEEIAERYMRRDPETIRQLSIFD